MICVSQKWVVMPRNTSLLVHSLGLCHTAVYVAKGSTVTYTFLWSLLSTCPSIFLDYITQGLDFLFQQHTTLHRQDTNWTEIDRTHGNVMYNLPLRTLSLHSEYGYHS